MVTQMTQEDFEILRWQLSKSKRAFKAAECAEAANRPKRAEAYLKVAEKYETIARGWAYLFTLPVVDRAPDATGAITE